MSDSEESIRYIFSDAESESDFEGDDIFNVPRYKRREEDDELQGLLSAAQLEYANGNADVALKLLEEIIKERGDVKEAYQLLSTIHDERGDEKAALVARVAAAHITASNANDWLEILSQLEELGLYRDASYVYQQLTRAMPDNYELRMRRVRCLQEIGEHTQALSVLGKIRRKFFQEIDESEKVRVLLQTGEAYKTLGRIRDAHDLFMGVFNENVNHGQFSNPEVELDWQCLTALLETLFDLRQYQKAITICKDGARYILGRGEDTFWRDVKNDGEFDERRFDHEFPPDEQYQYAKLYNNNLYLLPPDVRIWLLVCRIRLYAENKTETPSPDIFYHLAFLKQYDPPEHFADLYQRAGQEFFSAGLYLQAQDLYNSLSGFDLEDKETYVEAVLAVAKCQSLLHKKQEAVRLYKIVLNNDPDNYEALLGLAEVYHDLKDTKQAKELITRALALRDEAPGLEELWTAEPDEENNETDPALFVVDRKAPFKKTIYKARMEQKLTKLADACFDQLQRFQRGLENNNPVAASEWIRNALTLIQIFSANKKFFPADRNKQPVATTRDERLATLQVFAADDEDEEDEEGTTRYKGRGLDQWFKLFMETALARAKFDSVEGAYKVVRTGKLSNIFHSDEHREKTMNFVMLACAYGAKDYAGVAENVRALFMIYQFNPEILLYYYALLPSGNAAMTAFGNSNNQKYFLRFIKALDGIVNHKEVKGAALQITKNPVTIEDGPWLFVLYSHIMLMGPSYTPAMTYLLWASEHIPNDPMVLLTLGVVCLQRALQRVTPNRHKQILQGFSYMSDYADTRNKTEGQKQEAQYNLGRFFHGLGLFSTALTFYLRVFDFDVSEPYDLRKETAYNMHLIAGISGDMWQARKYIDEYLEI